MKSLKSIAPQGPKILLTARCCHAVPPGILQKKRQYFFSWFLVT